MAIQSKGPAMGFTAEVVNLEKVLRAFGALADEVADAAEEAAVTEAKKEFFMTQRRTPRASSQLWMSGRVEDTDYSVDEITVGIAYGGPAGSGRNTEDVDYALIVHEDLNATHKQKGRGAKFVESVLREELESGRAVERMSTTIRTRLGWD